MATEQTNILVIKLGAFGDFIQALGPMAAIRRHHQDTQITLLTTAPFANLAKESGYFDHVWVDQKPNWRQRHEIRALGERLRGGGFARVYDLQNNDRTALYLRLFGWRASRRPEWVGAARGASHRNASPARTAGTAFAGHKQTLALAGITDVTIDRLDWVQADSTHFNLPEPYVLLVPGCSPTNPGKRWPARHFGTLAKQLAAWGLTPVVIGTAPEDHLAQIIHTACPETVNLCGRTSLLELVPLARNAAGAVGNDTGPMHMIAPTGCPSIILFTPLGNPARHAPLGEKVRVLFQNDDLGIAPAHKILKQITPHDFR